MGYQALYRVWRPQQFSDVVGQEHVTRTLQNALLQGKISHAYLFTGPRGTGKTSAAKIFAKAVNCERAPVSEPCNECPSCKGITDGSIADVIEIDAASNNGVDEIRDIREKVKFAPSVVKYKVYIIDEVHMLSIGAFNALLNTLEEPPKPVSFILATTEPHKIPLTIISRCQRFDFKRIPAAAIVDRMKRITEETGVRCEEQALNIIARAADGGMRDAISLLDQAISFSDDYVTVEDALTVTGSVSQSLLSDLAHAVENRDAAAGLAALEQLMAEGKDAVRFIEDFIMFYRDLLLYKTAPNLEESLERVSLNDDFRALADRMEYEEIYKIIEILSKAQQEMRWTTNPKIFLEVAVVKLCHRETEKKRKLPEIDSLLARISRLEEELEQLKRNGIAAHPQENAASAPKRARMARRGYQAPVGKINEILNEATRADLNKIRGSWGELMSRLMPSHAALLKEAEPAAASAEAVVIKFKHEIHCQMAMERADFLSTIRNLLLEMTGSHLQIVAVPEQQWLSIREDFVKNYRQGEAKKPEFVRPAEENPVVTEAVKLFGDDLIEIRD